MNPAHPVQQQLEAYNARDLERFVAQYTDDIEVFRAPGTAPILSGKEAFAAHYAAHRFHLAGLHADVVSRMVAGNLVIDHERVVGIGDQPVQAVAVYEVIDDLIRRVWFFTPA